MTWGAVVIPDRIQLNQVGPLIYDGNRAALLLGSQHLAGAPGALKTPLRRLFALAYALGDTGNQILLGQLPLLLRCGEAIDVLLSRCQHLIGGDID